MSPSASSTPDETLPRQPRIHFMSHATWEDALFLHHEVCPVALQNLLPPGLLIDTLHGKAYVSVVALSENGIVPALSGPASLWKLLAVSHNAVNVRTYVRHQEHGEPGIFFFSLDCDGVLPTFGARALFNLPYRLAAMTRERPSVTRRRFTSRRHGLLGSSDAAAAAALTVEWDVHVTEGEGADAEGEASAVTDELADFLVERYRLYCEPGPALRALLPSGCSTWCGSITHKPWPVRRTSARVAECTVLRAAGLESILVPGASCVAHCSVGVADISFFWEGGRA